MADQLWDEARSKRESQSSRVRLVGERGAGAKDQGE